MAADKMRAGFGDERFQFAHDAGLDAANVGDNRAGFQRRQHPIGEQTHLRERRAKDDEVGFPNGGQQIGRGKIHRARLLTILQTGGAADETRGLARELAGV